MINTSEIHSVQDKALNLDKNNPIRRHINNAPLLAVGTAVGAGVVAWLLLGPRLSREQNLMNKVMKNINGISPHKKVGRNFKAVIGAWTLNYLSRKVKNKLHLR